MGYRKSLPLSRAARKEPLFINNIEEAEALAVPVAEAPMIQDGHRFGAGFDAEAPKVTGDVCLLEPDHLFFGTVSRAVIENAGAGSMPRALSFARRLSPSRSCHSGSSGLKNRVFPPGSV